ncbi:hypothetical protein AB1N83_013838 [Pleurotus pulmonarius]
MTTVINVAEEESRLKLQAFPDHVVESVRGILNEGHIKRQVEFQASQTKQNQIQADIDTMKGLLEVLVPLTSRRQLHQWSTAGPSRSSPSLSSASTPDGPTPPLPASTAPMFTSSSMAQPSQSIPHTAITHCGTIYPHSVFPLSQDIHEREQQLSAIDTLESKFPPDRLKRHAFEWKVSNNEWLPYYQWWKPNPGTYPSIEQIWTEHELGMDGQLSIRELGMGWDARWKRNKQNIKSEYSRRMKIVNLVRDLAAKPNWNNTIALRFLTAKYPIPTPAIPHLKSMRAFIEHLQKAGGVFHDEIMNTALSYTT